MNTERGKLKIFFGYSAGVGKTYAMLKAARELNSEGVDIVIGYIEPHDRPETAEMAKGLTAIPTRKINYKGLALQEFDIDEALKQHHRIVLVDELAHTNVPGSKNTKRYLDVEELLNNGIDVWTTVNVQHIEGLHDLVDSATSVDVNERIPDEIFDYADEVVLIDIEPSALLQRMKEGKIYPGNRAKVALENFFNTDNLMSLREIFMRRGAERIEKQTNDGELPTKILVLISPSPSSAKNIRFASRMADAYHRKYSAMYVETNGSFSDESAANLKKHMRLIKDTGGELIVKYGDDIVETVADYVKTAGITDLIIGKTWRSTGKKAGLEEKFVLRLPDIAIIIIPDYVKNAFKPASASLFRRFFMRGDLQEKFRSTNKTLDIIDLLAKTAKVTNNGTDMWRVTEILGTAFERSCLILKDRKRYVYRYKNEDIGFFDDENEKAVAEWCLKNEKPAGIGTDTLRETKAVYLPVVANDAKAVIVAFSCLHSKMTVTEKIIFEQIKAICKIIFQR